MLSPGNISADFSFSLQIISFSFCFLLWGLSAVASSVNLLVLKFMTISLEEEEQGDDELHEMGANVVTLEEEVVRLLTCHHYWINVNFLR